MYSVTIGLSAEDIAASKSAAYWCGQFYPDVTVTTEEESVTLSSTQREEPVLKAIWSSGLANERLLQGNLGFRSAILHRLAQ